jgi:hypothetical protein
MNFVPPEFQNDSVVTVWTYVMHERYVHDFQRFLPPSLIRESAQALSVGSLQPLDLDPVLSSTAQELALQTAVLACPGCQFPMQPEQRVCGRCGFCASLELKDALVRQAFEAAYFGWRYRKKFEEDVAGLQGSKVPPRHYFLALPDNFEIWLAGAVAAGMAGNLAYDLAKAAVLLTWKQAGSIKRAFTRPALKGANQQQNMSLTDDQEIVEHFISYVWQYYAGLRDADSIIAATSEWAYRMEAVLLYRISNGLPPSEGIPLEETERILANPQVYVAAFIRDLRTRREALNDLARVRDQLRRDRDASGRANLNSEHE